MEHGMDMEEFIKEVSRREEAKKDFIVPPRKMMMADDTKLLIDNISSSFDINHVAHKQIANKLDIPKTFYDSLPSRKRGIRTELVNSLFSIDTEKRLVRTLDGTARALLSDSFKPIDNFLVLSSVLPVMAKHKDLRVTSLQLSETRMYMQMVFPRLTGEVKVGQPVQFGITMSNSEVGYGSQDVRQFIYVLRCSNGMIGQSIMRSYHVGRRIDADEEDYSIYSDETIKADLRSFQLRLTDTLKSAISQDKFQKLLDSLKASTEQMFDVKNVDSVVENVTKKYIMTKDEGEKILKNLWKEKDNSKWALSNAITAVAHTSPDIDRQYELEKFGNDIVFLPKKEWASIIEG